MLFSAKISALEAQVAALTKERDTFQASVTELTQANADCRIRFDADQVTISEHLATISTLTTDRDTHHAEASRLTTELADANAAKQKLEADMEASVAKEVTSRLAAAGVDPVKRDPNAAIDKTTGGKSGLSPRQRLAAHINAQITK